MEVAQRKITSTYEVQGETFELEYFTNHYFVDPEAQAQALNGRTVLNYISEIDKSQDFQGNPKDEYWYERAWNLLREVKAGRVSLDDVVDFMKGQGVNELDIFYYIERVARDMEENDRDEDIWSRMFEDDGFDEDDEDPELMGY